MLTSNARTMLGSVRSGTIAATGSYDRQDHREPWTGRGLSHGLTHHRAGGERDAARRALKRAERLALAHELEAEDLAEDLDAFLADEFDAYGWMDLAWATEPEPEPYLGCMCRRCYLHDDPANCEYLAYEPVGLGVTRMGDRSDVYPSNARYDLDDEDLPGWGSARVAYEDFTTGFRVTDRP